MVVIVTVQRYNILRLQQFDAKALGLLTQARGKLQAGNTFRKAGKIVKFFGDGGLATESGAFDHQSITSLAGHVKRSRQTGWTTANHDHIKMTAFYTGLETNFYGQVSIAWFDQTRAI